MYRISVSDKQKTTYSIDNLSITVLTHITNGCFTIIIFFLQYLEHAKGYMHIFFDPLMHYMGLKLPD